MTSSDEGSAAPAHAGLRDRFVEGMSRAACTVNIVTTDGPAGRAGLTVSAMSSVSADGPAPRLLICVHRDSAACQAILMNGVFCVNLLRADQSTIADLFAGRTGSTGEERFDAADWIPMATGAPRLSDPLAAFDCQLSQADQFGTHYVMMGKIEAVYFAEAGDPLIYANRSYGTSSRLPRAA